MNDHSEHIWCVGDRAIIIDTEFESAVGVWVKVVSVMNDEVVMVKISAPIKSVDGVVISPNGGLIAIKKEYLQPIRGFTSHKKDGQIQTQTPKSDDDGDQPMSKT